MHLTIRVPWHDNGWTTTFCRQPTRNSFCLNCKHIRRYKKDALEECQAGQSWVNLAYPQSIRSTNRIYQTFF